jgi:hypothetical protein
MERKKNYSIKNIRFTLHKKEETLGSNVWEPDFFCKNISISWYVLVFFDIICPIAHMKID